MNKFDAITILQAVSGGQAVDFHRLDSSQVETVLAYADRFKYRKPRNANGSRARYFYAYVCRAAARKES